MGLSQKYVLPKFVHLACGWEPNRRQRQKVVPLARGEVLEVSARVVERGAEHVTADCRLASSDREAAAGRLTVGLLPLGELCRPELTAERWKELHAAS